MLWHSARRRTRWRPSTTTAPHARNGDGPPKTAHLDDSRWDRPLQDRWSGNVIATVGGNVPEIWAMPLRAHGHTNATGHTMPVLDILRSTAADVNSGNRAEDREVVIWDAFNGNQIVRRTFSSSGTGSGVRRMRLGVYIAGRRGALSVGHLDRAELLTVAREHVTRMISPRRPAPRRHDRTVRRLSLLITRRCVLRRPLPDGELISSAVAARRRAASAPSRGSQPCGPWGRWAEAGSQDEGRLGTSPTTGSVRTEAGGSGTRSDDAGPPHHRRDRQDRRRPAIRPVRSP